MKLKYALNPKMREEGAKQLRDCKKFLIKGLISKGIYGDH
jgi:hypothetical protein